MQNNSYFQSKFIQTILFCGLFLLLALSPQIVHSQTMEGSIRYLVVHNQAKKMAAVDYISKQRRERISYMLGNKWEWKVYTQMYFTPTATKYIDSEERAEPEDEGYSWRKDAFWVKRDFANNTRHDALTIGSKTYIIQDTIAPQAWKVLNDLKEVAGHLCMNATWEDTVKSQKVTVWFALDMPLSGGPELFCGLPGMILEVDVNDGGMVITADKIEMKKITTELDLPKKTKGKKVNETQYVEELKKVLDQRRKDEEPPFWGMRY